MRRLILVALLLATPAAAQTTTNCRPTGFGSDRSFECTSRERLQPPAPSETGFQASQNAYNRLQGISAHDRASQARQQVGSLLAAGRCDDARNTALQAGDFPLADYVTRSCGR